MFRGTVRQGPTDPAESWGRLPRNIRALWMPTIQRPSIEVSTASCPIRGISGRRSLLTNPAPPLNVGIFIHSLSPRHFPQFPPAANHLAGQSSGISIVGAKRYVMTSQVSTNSISIPSVNDRSNQLIRNHLASEEVVCFNCTHRNASTHGPLDRLKYARSHTPARPVVAIHTPNASRQSGENGCVPGSSTTTTFPAWSKPITSPWS